MTMECANCGNQHAHKWKVAFTNEGRFENCESCGHVGSTWQPDVYFPGQHHDPNIVDQLGRPILLESKQHKATLMRERGMREANDRLHGGPGHRFGVRK